MTTTERAVYIYNALRKAGMTYAGAIGTIGNLQGETSDFDPMSCETSYLNRFKLTDAEYTKRADNGEVIYNGKYFEKDSAGYGIVQWTYYMRKRNLLNYAKSLDKSVGDLDVQIAFMLKEMQESYTDTWKVVSMTNDYSKAVKICVTNYEKPANQSQAISTRCAYAKSWMNIIKDESITPDEPKQDEPKQDDTPVIGNSFDRKKIVALAESEVGYLEKKTNSQLDDKTANAGFNNYTKYARDLDAVKGFYNGNKQGYAWCDVFVDWLFVKCFGVENALNLLCQKMGSSGAGCTYSLNYYIANKQYYTRATKPQVGDQIFFGNVGSSNHTGLVYKVDDKTVYTIEGNTSGSAGVISNGGGVFKKSYPRNYSSIAGYGRPNYNDGFVGDSVEESDVTPVIPTEPKQDDNTSTLTGMPEIQKGDKGLYVKKAQQLLIAKGYSCGSFGADGDFGAGTYNAVIAFQKANGLEVDGIIGEATWAKLLGDDIKDDEPTEVKKDNVPAPTPTKTQFDRQALLDIAYAEVGYLEKKSESQLDDRQANAGQANFNKYARDLDAIKNYYYHDRKQGLNWCDIFCDWCFVKAYGENDSFTVNCQPQYSYGAGCPQSMAYYKAQNRLDMKPQIGDQFFLSDGMGSTGHTGLVVGVSDTMIDTIEGNQEVRNGVDGVVKKKRYISEMAGFGHPMYNDGYGTDDYIGKKPEEPKPKNPDETEVVFNPPELKKGDKGMAVKKLQHLLIDSSISCGSSGADADFGSGTYNAIKIAQAKAKIPATGIADKATWAWLINN